jgi:hydroxymethylpyrimidine kinase/phosphomethylpyrimidine kinase
VKNGPKVCLTVAGLDPSGGAGVVADIRTFEKFGCRSAAAITSITFQNSERVLGSVHLTGEQVQCQLEPVFKELEVAAIKIGMLPTAEVVRSVAAALRSNNARNIVIDTVMTASSGSELIERDAADAIVKELFPLATLVTPNLPEAERLTGISIIDEAELREAAGMMQRAGGVNVLIKGGHMEVDSDRSRDFLFTENAVEVFEAPRINGVSVRGTGCMLSAAIAANLALGHDLSTAVGIAKDHVHSLIAAARLSATD